MINIHFIISLIHIFITGPLFIYIGIKKPSNILFYLLLAFLAIIIVISFIYRYIYKELYAWLYVHLLLFASLLFYISYLKFTKDNIPNFLYSLLIAIGFGAIGYHLTKIIRKNKK
jgi:uncharacterized membrane protein YoaK (UPF0700 family)